MKYKLVCFVLLLAGFAGVEGQGVKFDKYFTGGTLRLDCVREGDVERDTVWVERWLDRSAEWHGSRRALIDPFDNGEYRVEMLDDKSGKVIYAQGYSTLFREWREMAREKGLKERGRMEETLLLPMPKKKVKIVLMKRDKEMRLVTQTTTLFDPKHKDLEFNYHIGESVALEVHGSPAEKVDVVIVAQGYPDANDSQLQVDYYRMREILFAKEPFASRRDDFNVYGVCADVNADFNTFDIDRYVMTQDVWRLHNMLGTTPCDYIIIMVNSGKYGGGAIYNFYSVTTMHGMAKDVLPHELGHGIGGLADEYVDENLSYGELHVTDYEPLEPNITNQKQFEKKWKAMMGVDGVGLYEGAGYMPKGLWRPTEHCMMRDYAPFCPVCRKRLEEVIDWRIGKEAKK